jgi:hypothetical protein
MPRTKRLLPIASALGPTLGPPLKTSVTDEEWQRLEGILGQVLSPGIREEVIEATDRFLRFAVFEFTREPFDEASSRLNALRKASNDFLSALVEAARGGDGAFHALQLFQRHLVDPKIRGRRKLSVLTNIVTSVVVACEKAHQEVFCDVSSGHQRGDSWNRWMVNLTEILERNDLPTAARKDATLNKSGRPSAFVLFVEELQKSFSERFRRGTHSAGALTEAIGRARRVTKEPMSEKNKTRKHED